MKIIKWMALTGAFFLIGCAQPTFDANDKYILYAKGKAYAIPFGVNYNAHIKESGYRVIRYAGIQCSNNGITWHEKRFSDEMGKSRNTSDLIKYMKYGYQHKLLGCSEPLRKDEYQDLLNIQSRTVTHHCPMCKSK